MLRWYIFQLISLMTRKYQSWNHLFYPYFGHGRSCLWWAYVRNKEEIIIDDRKVYIKDGWEGTIVHIECTMRRGSLRSNKVVNFRNNVMSLLIETVPWVRLKGEGNSESIVNLDSDWETFHALIKRERERGFLIVGHSHKGQGGAHCCLRVRCALWKG